MQTKKWRLGTRARLLLRGFRYAQILPYASIDGWLTVDEAIALYEAARSLPDGARALEIGSWQGKSTVCLAKGLAARTDARLTCIDPFDASGDDQSSSTYGERAGRLGGPLRQAFEQNLREAGLWPLIDVHQGFSHELGGVVDGPFDLLFLDGDHSYEAIHRDFTDWTPKLRPGGLLLMHDVVHPVHEGPRRVVTEQVEGRRGWCDVRYVDSLLLAKKSPS